MGLDLSSWRFMDVVDIQTCYCRVRDIVTSKRDTTGVFTINYTAVILKDDKEIDRRTYVIESPEESKVNPWLFCYDNLKTQLTEDKITHTNNL